MLTDLNRAGWRRCTTVIAAVLVTIASSGSAFAQQFPRQAVEMTVLFGGSSATIAQVLADAMSTELGVPVAAVSRTGAGGAVGYAYVKSRRPTGYDIVWNSNSISTVFHSGNIDFDYRTFEPVARVGMEVPALAVRADSSWRTLDEFAAAARTKRMRVGISGRGSFIHLVSAALFDKLGIDVIYVPYGQGTAPTELLGGRVDAALQWPSQFKAQVDARQLRVIAVTGRDRVPVLPDVPTAIEQGYDVDMVMWRGLAAPMGTPSDVIARLETAVRRVVASPRFREVSATLGFEPAFLPASEFGRVIATDDAAIGRLMAQLGLKR
ncbi:MAG: tripartite tricarboxylate transporter substrate binding protein [Acidobacteria bacterium]|nr:tripartite tricarboxylate transporter substrate binding protein [Acidobacteriota bacterium]